MGNKAPKCIRSPKQRCQLVGYGPKGVPKYYQCVRCKVCFSPSGSRIPAPVRRTQAPTARPTTTTAPQETQEAVEEAEEEEFDIIPLPPGIDDAASDEDEDPPKEINNINIETSPKPPTTEGEVVEGGWLVGDVWVLDKKDNNNNNNINNSTTDDTITAATGGSEKKGNNANTTTPDGGLVKTCGGEGGIAKEEQEIPTKGTTTTFNNNNNNHDTYSSSPPYYNNSSSQEDADEALRRAGAGALSLLSFVLAAVYITTTYTAYGAQQISGAFINNAPLRLYRLSCWDEARKKAFLLNVSYSIRMIFLVVLRSVWGFVALTFVVLSS